MAKARGFQKINNKILPGSRLPYGGKYNIQGLILHQVFFAVRTIPSPAQPEAGKANLAIHG